eukprot:Colp12_sorted_trinity150504_noHs@7044
MPSEKKTPEEVRQLLLDYLDANNEVADTLKFASEQGLEHQEVVGAVKSLETKDELISTKDIKTPSWVLSDEGNQIAEEGSHEAKVFNAIPATGITQDELMKVGAYAKIGFGKAVKNGWIALDKSSKPPMVTRKVESIVDSAALDLQKIKRGEAGSLEANNLKDLKSRKLISQETTTSYQITKGAKFSRTVEKLETDLTAEMISSGSWAQAKFRGFNFKAKGVPPPSGHLHPLLKVRQEFREIFLEMGFTEMPTNNFIESSFWNFDALFQPQQHPARDSHDTFFIKDPETAPTLPPAYLSAVKEMHEKGGHGSIGYRYDWKEKEFKPAKYFSIDRVFRNEAMDATHLAEFHQIEGLVADHNLTLGDLIGVISEFFKKMGIEKLRFKPAYNPYTEPSMEIFSYHEGLQKWVEIGNSGVFRPEMLQPMGLPEDVVVIAWGLSLERPTMIKYGIDNIRELMGYRVNLSMVHNNPICRLDR